MTISPLPLIDVSDVPSTWPDDVVDLTDRRRLLVLAVLGVDVPRPMVDTVFAPAGNRRCGPGRDEGAATSR